MATDEATTRAEAQRRAEEAGRAFEAMSEAEAVAWLEAGDHTSVAGIPLTEEASGLIDEYASRVEVQGFELGPGRSMPLDGLSPGLQTVMVKVVDKSSPKLFAACATGKHIAEAKLT